MQTATLAYLKEALLTVGAVMMAFGLLLFFGSFIASSDQVLQIGNRPTSMGQQMIDFRTVFAVFAAAGGVLFITGLWIRK